MNVTKKDTFGRKRRNTIYYEALRISDVCVISSNFVFFFNLTQKSIRLVVFC